MSQTQTSPVSSRPRIRSRVASASALNRRFHLRELLGHIFVLTNISRLAYSLYIRFCRYIRKEHDMSDIQQAVREKYGAIAASVTQGVDRTRGCCGPTACGCGDPITSNLYSDAETSGLPADAVDRVARLRQPDGAARARSRARRCSTSDPAAASTCCSRPSASARPARPTAST